MGKGSKSGGPRTGKNKAGKHTGAGELPGRSAMPGMTLTVGKGKEKRSTRFQ